jgi:hypothetical protein
MKQIISLDQSIYTKDRKNMKVKNLRLLVPCALQNRAKRKNWIRAKEEDLQRIHSSATTFSKVYFPMAGFRVDFITGLTFTSKISLK